MRSDTRGLSPQFVSLSTPVSFTKQDKFWWVISRIAMLLFDHADWLKSLPFQWIRVCCCWSTRNTSVMLTQIPKSQVTPGVVQSLLLRSSLWSSHFFMVKIDEPSLALISSPPWWIPSIFQLNQCKNRLLLNPQISNYPRNIKKLSNHILSKYSRLKVPHDIPIPFPGHHDFVLLPQQCRQRFPWQQREAIHSQAQGTGEAVALH